MTVPAAAAPLIGFASLLRRHGFPVAPDQTAGFIEAVGKLGPRGMADIRSAAVALFAIAKEREPDFDALFRAYFMGQTVAAPVSDDRQDDDDIEIREDRRGEIDAPEADGPEGSGRAATTAERLARRRFPERNESAILARFRRSVLRRLPRRKSRRFVPSPRGPRPDLRQTLRDAVRHDGDAMNLFPRARKLRQRRILFLIDISGSMKERTEWALRLAHVLVSEADRFEVFTLGTRLTRITRALGVRDQGRALARVGSLAADMDGGTRIGDALQAFLSVPRYVGFARGAAIVVLSDGLERGDPAAMIDAVRRLSLEAWRLFWLTPLAGDHDFSPDTAALTRILPRLDGLGDGSTLDRVAEHFLELGHA